MSAFRFLYYTDTHFTLRFPRSRRDDYGAAIRGKLGAIAQIGRDRKVDAFFDGGDLFHHSTQTPLELVQLMEAIKQRHSPTLAIIGNHPIQANYDTWYPRSGIRVLAEAFNIGFPYYQDAMDCPAFYQILDPVQANVPIHKQFGFGPARGKNAHVVRMHHTQLVKNPVIWDHVLWQDYDPGPSTIVLCSDFHGFQGHEVVNGIHFIAPGAVTRNSMGADDMTRKPQCALVTIETSGLVHVEFIVLPHEPAASVFAESGTIKPTVVERDVERLDACIERLKKMASEDVGLSPEDTLKQVARTLDVHPDSVTYAMETLERTKT